MGIMGAAIATAISYMVIGVYRMLDCQKAFFFYINYLKIGVCALIVVCEAILVIVSNYRYALSIISILIIALIYNHEIKECVVFLKKFIKKRY